MNVNARRNLALVLVTLLAMLGLSACASIPRAGAVKPGGTVNQVDTNTVEFFPAGPLTDATQEQIVRGFIEAATGPHNDYAVARSFLAPDFQTKWDPNQGVIVDSGLREYSSAGQNSAQVTISVSATLDGAGQYASLATPVAKTLGYSFAQVQGQWRITAAPQGVVIDRGVFEQVYTTHPLYFFEPSYNYLVPDVRWFARGASTTTRMVKAILQGPASWLADGGPVATAFPAGTALVASAVPILKNVALVDLNAPTVAAEPLNLMRMRQQLTASLLGVNDVTSVELLTEGVPVNQGGYTNVDALMPVPVDSRPYVVSDRSTGFLDGDNIAASPLAAVLPGTAVQALTLSPGARAAAVLTGSGVSLARLGSALTSVDSRPGLIGPALDVFNYVWTVPANAPAQLTAFGSDGKPFAVAVPWGSASSIHSLKISHDGARVLVVLGSGEQRSLAVAAISRGENNAPKSIGRLVTVTEPAGSLIDAAWVDSTTVIAMANSSFGTSLMTQVIGGKSQSVVGLSQNNAVSIAGANTLAQVRVLLADGRLLTLRNSTVWLSTATGIQVLATQQ